MLDVWVGWEYGNRAAWSAKKFQEEHEFVRNMGKMARNCDNCSKVVNCNNRGNISEGDLCLEYYSSSDQIEGLISDIFRAIKSEDNSAGQKYELYANLATKLYKLGYRKISK